MYDIYKINKELDSLKMPKEFRNRIVKLDKFFNHDITVQLSIRKDAGKTTQALILGLVLYKLYGTTTEYIRNDKIQITKGNIETLYDVVLRFDYVKKLFKDYNTIVYKSMTKKFYLAYESETDTGEKTIEYMSDTPLCHVSSNEEYLRLKSSYNNPNGDFLILDECMDTQRTTSRLMIELQNNISTITRLRSTAHLLMLGNNVDQYSIWWEEFDVADKIETLQFGGYIDEVTELGTTLYIEMLSISEEQKEKIKHNHIRFSGFNTPKMSTFNGIECWQGSSHPHIPYDELLKNEPFFNLVWIKHRNKYIRLNLYHDKQFGWYVYAHFSNKPKLEDGFILTTTPMAFNETYGYGTYCYNKKARKLLLKIWEVIKDHRIYFQSNSVGNLYTNYLRDIKE